MRVIVFVKATAQSEAGVMPSQELLTEMGKFNQQLVNAGVMQAGEGLHPSSKGVRVQFSGKSRTVTDGPFAETKELVAGFWIWKVKSMEEAIAWAQRCPNPMQDEGVLEIRPVFEPEDFGPALTPELCAQEQRLRRQIEGKPPVPARFETIEGKLVAGLSQHFTLATRAEIPALWTRFAPSIGKVPGQVGMSAYGVSYNWEPSKGFDYLAGVEVADSAGLPSDFTHVRLPEGRYAVFAHQDHVSAIPQTIDAIWSQWLPQSGFEARPAPCFERYTEEFCPDTGTDGMEIWVAIRD